MGNIVSEVKNKIFGNYAVGVIINENNHPIYYVTRIKLP